MQGYSTGTRGRFHIDVEQPTCYPHSISSKTEVEFGRIWGDIFPLRFTHGFILVSIGCAFLSGRMVRAACDLIPGTSKSFRSSLGNIDRPFAGPGDFVALNIVPACDGSSPGFGPSPSDQWVVVVFTPPNGPENAVAMSTDCMVVQAELQGCGVSLNCRDVDEFGEPTDLQIFERDGERRLRFRFPNTDPELAPNGDERTLAGPARIVVIDASQVSACSGGNLLTQPCANQTDRIACVDVLFDVDGTCGTEADRTFPHFTALPVRNNYQALCAEPSPPCTGNDDELRFTTDTAGNVLIPVDWRGILVGQGVPVARLLRGSSSVEAFPGEGSPITIPGSGFLRSFSPEGGLLPPVFDPQADPTALGEATLFGSADAPETVLRIARRSPVFRQCSTGINDGLPCIEDSDCPVGNCVSAKCVGGDNGGASCTADTDCPGGECGPSLFDFSTRYEGSVGPVVVSRFGMGVCQGGSNEGLPCTDDLACPGSVCVVYRLEAQDPVPLDGLNQTEKLNAFVVSEAVNAQDLNGDGDSTDDVVILSDRRTGLVEAIGDASSKGRAAARIHQPPFSFPAIATEGDVLAFLEPEPMQGYQDLNGNGDIFETILRVYRLAGGTEITAGLNVAADAAPLINGRSIALSSGLVFFRWSEAANAQQVTEEVSSDSGALDPRSHYSSISADGRLVAYSARLPAIMTYDRVSRVRTMLSPLESGATVDFFWPPATSMSADGRYVAFDSTHPSLVPLDTNGFKDVFVVDRTGSTTERVSVATGGAEAMDDTSIDSLSSPGGSINPSISADGRYVAFESDATDLVVGDTNGVKDVFVHDRATVTTERISIAPGGAQSNGYSRFPVISADGRYVVFESAANNLVTGAAPGRLFVRDLLTGVTEAIPAGAAQNAVISGDGRYVAFGSAESDLVPGDTNDFFDTFVYDRATGRMERVSVSSTGAQAIGGHSGWPSMSPDARYVAFMSHATGLVPNDTNEDYDAFVHDRLTGLTKRVSVESGGGQIDVGEPGQLGFAGGYPAVASNGHHITFEQIPSGLSRIRVHGADFTDTASDVSGDGDPNDTVLAVVETADGTVTPICPANMVAVVGDVAAFLRPEAAGATPDLPGCPTGPLSDGRPDLNGDGDGDDDVTHLWRLSPLGVTNLRCAATQLALSATHVAALVSEAAQGDGALNSDGDTDDDVVEIYDLGASAPASCAEWTNLGQAADTLDTSALAVAFITPESAQGVDLNGDGDQDDRVLQVHDLGMGTTTTLGAAEDFVLGANLLAFRTPEASEGNTDLNGDGDTLDDVLQVYDLISSELFNTAQAVTPCRLEACDPRLPYRVLTDTLRFLTFEADQAEDLNDDGDANDLILQTFNVRAAQLAGGGGQLVFGMSAPQRFARALIGALGPAGVPQVARAVIGGTSTGICTTTGEACVDDTDCAGGACFVPPGGCILDQGTSCNPASPITGCPAGQFCQPLTGSPGVATCRERVGDCRDDGDCTAPATCNEGQQDIQRLVGPLAAEGGQVFAGAGRCVEDVMAVCEQDTDCAAGEFCRDGTCHRSQLTCLTGADCPEGAQCEHALLTATARDSDGDELADPVDNCPDVPNVTQEDIDCDGLGDACDAEPRNAIRGRILYYSADRPVPDVAVELVDSSRTVASDADGTYELDALSCSRVQIEPNKPGDLTGISSLDASYVLQAVVGLRTFDRFETLACDVTGNGTLSSLDAARILQRRVGILDEFDVAAGCGSDWAFVPAAAPALNQTPVEPIVNGGSCQPGGLIYDPLGGFAARQDFLGVLFGDCTGNWQPPAMTSSAARVARSVSSTVFLGPVERIGRRWIRIPLRARADSLHALDIDVEYDPAELRFRRARRGRGARSAILVHNEQRQGFIKISMASAGSLNTNDALAELDFTVRRRRRRAYGIRVIHAEVE